MRDMRPNLIGKAEVFRYYKKKDTQKLILSKKPIVELVSNGYYTCREDIASMFRSDIERKIENKVVSSNEYELVSLASINEDNKLLTTTSGIGLLSSGLGFPVDNKKNADRLCLTLDYILGILGVCLSHGDEEKERRNKGVGCAGSYEVSGKDTMTPKFWYNVLSPFWINSPVLVSLVYGIARDCYIMNADSDINIDDLFENKWVEVKEEIYRIINEVDYKSAIKVYRDIILKWYERDGVAGSLYIDEEERYDEDEGEYYYDNDEQFNEEDMEISLLSNSRYVDAIELLIGKDGYQAVFNPKKVKEYWQPPFDSYGYGVNTFCADISSGDLRIYKK